MPQAVLMGRVLGTAVFICLLLAAPSAARSASSNCSNAGYKTGVQSVVATMRDAGYYSTAGDHVTAYVKARHAIDAATDLHPCKTVWKKSHAYLIKGCTAWADGELAERRGDLNTSLRKFKDATRFLTLSLNWFKKGL